MTHPQTLAALLNYFRTGDTPTQDQCEELIRTMFDLTDAAQADADAAVALAESLQDSFPKLVARLEYDPTSYTWTAHLLRGATVAYSGTGNRTVTFTFTTPFTSVDDYFVQSQSSVSVAGFGYTFTISSTTQNTATLVLAVSDTSSSNSNTGILEVLAFGVPS
jgi:hypothetical protein